MVAAPENVLLVFHTTEGQTAKIAERIAETLRSMRSSVDVHAVETAPAPVGYDGVIVGDSIHARHHSRELMDYVTANRGELGRVTTALFQVSLASAKDDAEHAAAAHQMVEEILDLTGFDPDMVGLFAGALVYSRYGWLKRRLMRSIVRREGGGKTDVARDYEYTDWEAVEKFARDFAALVTSREGESGSRE